MRVRRISIGGAVAIVTASVLAATTHAATITVNTVADENGTGPDCSLREAIQAANTDRPVGGCPAGSGADTIRFSLSLPATITLTDPAGELAISSDMTINGPGATELAIDGNARSRVFHNTGNLMVSDLTIQKGLALLRAAGGAIYATGGALALTNCTLSGNSAGVGGAIYATGGTLTLTNCTLNGNSAPDDDGGAIVATGGTLALTDCTLSGNSAAEGGAISTPYGGTLTLTNCTLRSNGAGVGGAIFTAEDGTATLTNCTLSNNGAWVGGAIYAHATLALTNCTLNGNSAAYQNGGAIFTEGGGTATLTNCTLSDNTAGFSTTTHVVGGGIYNGSGGTLTLTNCTLSGNKRGGIYNDGVTTVRNTIIANNAWEGGDCVNNGAISPNSGHNLIEDTGANACGLINGMNGNLVGVDPQLGPLTDNGGPQTHALCTGAGVPDASCTGTSPAIDAVPIAACVDADGNSLTTDQRSAARPHGAACDIGAYEAGAEPATVCAGDCSGDHAVTVDEIVILVNIALGSAEPSACPAGVPSGTPVDVGFIIQAVNHALSGCTGT